MIRCTYNCFHFDKPLGALDFLANTVFDACRLIDHWNSQGSAFRYDVEKTRPYNDELPEDGWSTENGIAYCRVKGIRASMSDRLVASVLVQVAKMIAASDPDLEAVAEVVRKNSFMSLRRALEGLGLGKVSMDDSGDQMYWVIKARKGNIIIVSKAGAEPGSGDITVGNFIVGYS